LSSATPGRESGRPRSMVGALRALCYQAREYYAFARIAARPNTRPRQSSVLFATSTRSSFACGRSGPGPPTRMASSKW
jgi:hypothetical protein